MKNDKAIMGSKLAGWVTVETKDGKRRVWITPPAERPLVTPREEGAR